jgi:hypothetical protein
MEFFPIAALIIATFLLLIGIVGRGASMGSSQFHITLEGSIGRLPRVAILTASIVTYVLAIFLFVYAAESKSSPEPAPVTRQTEQSVSTITLRIDSTITEGATAETDTIVIEGEDDAPLILEMDTSTSSANGTFSLDERLDGVDVSYSLEVVLVKEDGTEETYSSEGVITAGDGLAYTVVFNEAGTSVELEPS